LEELREEGHLSLRQYQAGVMLLRMLQTWHGTSRGFARWVVERIDNGNYEEALEHRASKAHLGQLDNLLKGLRSHERELLKFLVVHRELPRGSLADWGRQHSGYKTNKTRRAVIVGRVTGFLDSVAELAQAS
jgi:hypothetical protein